MPAWFFLRSLGSRTHGLHQIFTKLAADKIGDGLGGFVVEATAAMTILLYLAWLRFGGTWNQTSSAPGVFYSGAHRDLCRRGTIMFSSSSRKAGRSPPCDDSRRWRGADGHCRHPLFKELLPSFGLLGITMALVGCFFCARLWESNTLVEIC